MCYNKECKFAIDFSGVRPWLFWDLPWVQKGLGQTFCQAQQLSMSKQREVTCAMVTCDFLVLGAS